MIDQTLFMACCVFLLVEIWSRLCCVQQDGCRLSTSFSTLDFHMLSGVKSLFSIDLQLIDKICGNQGSKSVCWCVKVSENGLFVEMALRLLTAL